MMSGNALRLLLFSAQADGHKYVYVTHSQTAGFKLSSHSQGGNKQNKGSPSFASHVEKGPAGFCAVMAPLALVEVLQEPRPFLLFYMHENWRGQKTSEGLCYL